jgi:hypothetical protein
MRGSAARGHRMLAMFDVTGIHRRAILLLLCTAALTLTGVPRIARSPASNYRRLLGTNTVLGRVTNGLLAPLLNLRCGEQKPQPSRAEKTEAAEHCCRLAHDKSG